MQSKKINRRELIGALGAAAGAAVAVGCGSSPTSPTSTATTTTTTGTNAACAVTPTETVGPYPSLTDLFRSDIREGKSGTLLTLTVKVVNANSGCAAISGANVEIWHVDAAGKLLAVRHPDDADVSSRDSDDQRQRRGDVHDDLPGLVSGTRHAHPSRGDDQRTIGEGHPDRLPRGRQQHRARQRGLRLAWLESDVERLGWDLRRQPVVGAHHADGRHRRRIRRDVSGGGIGADPDYFRRFSSRFIARSASVILSSTPLAGTSTLASHSSAFSMIFR